MEASVETSARTLEFEIALFYNYYKRISVHTERKEGGVQYARIINEYLRGCFLSICSYIITSKLYIFPLMAFIYSNLRAIALPLIYSYNAHQMSIQLHLTSTSCKYEVISHTCGGSIVGDCVSASTITSVTLDSDFSFE